MLEVTGQIKGKVYENTLLSVEEVCKLFNVSLPEKVYIEANRNTRRRDSFNQQRSLSAVNANTLINTTYEGNIVTVRYYKSKSSANSDTKYFPTRIRIQLPETVFDTAKDKEVALFAMLTPSCEQSPFRSKRRKLFRVKNNVAEAKSEIQQRLRLRQVEDKVLLEKNINFLRRIALGMNINRSRVSNPHDKTIDELKAGLLELFKKNPIEFANKFDDVTVKIEGLIQEAKHAGVIKLVSQGTVKAWVYSSNDEEIVRVTNQSPELALLYHLSQPEVFKIHYDKLEREIQSKGVNKAALAAIMNKESEVTTIENMSVEQLVEYAKVSEKIRFEPDNMRVALVDGLEDLGTLVKITDAKEWEQQVADKMAASNLIITKLKKHLR